MSAEEEDHAAAAAVLVKCIDLLTPLGELGRRRVFAALVAYFSDRRMR